MQEACAAAHSSTSSGNEQKLEVERDIENLLEQLFASDEGKLSTPSDLQRHACLRIRRSSGAIAPFRLIQDRKPVDVVVKGPLIANDFPTLVAAAREGLGLAQVPEPMAEAAIAAGELARVLAPLAPMSPGIFPLSPRAKASAAEASGVYRAYQEGS